MLKFVFNGYYRSGTTLIYRIMELSNPEALVLYEPLNPRLPVRDHGRGSNQTSRI